MRWRDKSGEWKRWFAVVPITWMDGETGVWRWVWLEWIWTRPWGEYSQISLTDPSGTASAAAHQDSIAHATSPLSKEGGEKL